MSGGSIATQIDNDSIKKTADATETLVKLNYEIQKQNEKLSYLNKIMTIFTVIMSIPVLRACLRSPNISHFCVFLCLTSLFIDHLALLNFTLHVSLDTKIHQKSSKLEIADRLLEICGKFFVNGCLMYFKILNVAK